MHHATAKVSIAAEPPNEVMAESWFLVQFKPNSHNIATRNLERQGVATFLPMQVFTRRHGTRFVDELRPLFPGYLFVSLSPAASLWRKVNSTYGVTRIVSFRDVPARVPDALITSLFDRCDDQGRVLTSTALKTGDCVRVINGPFSEFVGTIETIDADTRIWLLLDFMGQTNRVQVNANQVVMR